MLDLESDVALLELLVTKLRHIEHVVTDIARDAEDTGHPSFADRLEQLLGLVGATRAIPEALGARDAFRANLIKEK